MPLPPSPARALRRTALVAVLTSFLLTVGPVAAGAQSDGAPSTIPGGGSPTVVQETSSNTTGTLMFILVVAVIVGGAILLYVRNRPARTSS